MSNRSAIFASALAASLLASANFAAMAQNAAQPADTKTVDNCQSAPKGPAPAGSHWYFHLNRATKTKCWYLGEAKNRAATTETAQQQSAPALDATADAAPPLAQPRPVMRPSVADARAELASPQAAATPAAPADSGQAGATPDAGTPPDGDAPSSARWLDATSMARSNGTQHAASQPATADAQPQATAAAPAAPGAVETPAEKTSSSTEMLLIVMVGALALAGLVSALVFRLTRTRTPPYEIRDEWHAPWDSIRLERTPEIPVRADRPRRLSELPPRRAEPPMGRREIATDPDQADEKNRQITAMLQRLARSATN
jgi:hypothetical protein